MFDWLSSHPAVAALLRDVLIAVLSAVLGALGGKAAAIRELRRL